MDTPALTGAVPLIVGVTGHRDIRERDIPDLESAVRAVLDEIQARDPSRPLVLLTPLAEGADQLVARVATARGIKLVVPVPFAREAYETSLGESGGAIFGELFDGPSVVNRLCIPELDARGRGFDVEERRALQYALVGAYVSHHSDLLIALWSGHDSRHVGGTAQVVRYRRTGSFDIERRWLELLADAPEPFGVRESLLEPPDVGPLYHIVTPREDHPGSHHVTIGRAFVLPLDYESPNGTEHYERQLNDIGRHVTRFNADARRLEARRKADVDVSAQELYPDPESRTASSLPAGLAMLRRSYALADALAVAFQRRVHRALLGISALIFLAALAFSFFSHGFNETTGNVGLHVMLGLYAIIIMMADATFLVAHVGRWQDRYQDYRAVAEGLRVQFYWRLAGLPHSASDYYVRKQRDELSWIPRAVNDCGVPAPAREAGDEIDRLKDVHALWTKRQAAYYDRARRRAQQGVRWGHAGSGAVVASLFIGFIVLWDRSQGRPLLLGVFAGALLVAIIHAAVEVRSIFAGEYGASERSSRLKDGAARLAGGTVAAAFALLLVTLPGWAPARPGWELNENFLMTALGLTAVMGAVLHGYADRRAFAELTRHYGRVADVFARASRRLEELLERRDSYRARALILGLGKEALNDHGDWVMLHRERPIEPPEGAG